MMLTSTGENAIVMSSKTLHCVDVETGNRVWAYESNEHISSGVLTTDDAHVLINCREVGWWGSDQVHCIHV